MGVSAYRRTGWLQPEFVICDLLFVIGGASGDASGWWGGFQATYPNSNLHGLTACSFKCAADRSSIAGISSKRDRDMLLAAPTVIRRVQGDPGLAGDEHFDPGMGRH